MTVIARNGEGDMPVAMRERNQHLLNERHIHGRRTQVRVAFEVYCRDGLRPLNYSRLPGKHILLDAPTPEQAQAAIGLVQRVLQSIDGKWLAEELQLGTEGC